MMASRWEALGQVARNVLFTLNQDAPAFKTSCATLASGLLVAARCYVAADSAHKAQGTPLQDQAEEAEAQTVLREWGAFVTSYGVINVLSNLLGLASKKLFNVQVVKEGATGLLTGAAEGLKLAIGLMKPEQVQPHPIALSGQVMYVPGSASGIRFQQVLHNVARWTHAKPALVGLNAEALALKGFERLHTYGPPLVASAVGVVLSGWILERLVLKKGKAMTAYLRARQPKKQGPPANQRMPEWTALSVAPQNPGLDPFRASVGAPAATRWVSSVAAGPMLVRTPQVVGPVVPTQKPATWSPSATPMLRVPPPFYSYS